MYYIKKHYTSGEKDLPQHFASLNEAKIRAEELINKGYLDKDEDILYLCVYNEKNVAKKYYYSQHHFPF